MNKEMVDRIAARIEEERNMGGVPQGKAMYYKYFRVELYRRLYKADVDAILELDGYDDCIMSEEEIAAYVPE